MRIQDLHRSSLSQVSKKLCLHFFFFGDCNGEFEGEFKGDCNESHISANYEKETKRRIKKEIESLKEK